VASP